MMQISEHNRANLYTENNLAELFEVLDELHSAASDGQLNTVTTMNKRELVALLKDVIYTAQETLQELNKHDSRREEVRRESVLRVVEKPRSDQQSA